MHLYIKVWPDSTATIMTHTGQVVWTFSSAEEARKACSEWHNLVDGEPVIVHDEAVPAAGTIPSAA